MDGLGERREFFVRGFFLVEGLFEELSGFRQAERLRECSRGAVAGDFVVLDLLRCSDQPSVAQGGAPKIWPAVIHQPLHGVLGAVRIRTELDLIDVDGTVIDIRTSSTARIDQMHRFELATYARLPPGASGAVRSDILVARNTSQHLECTWEVTPADIRWSDALYPVAQHAMQRGYYMPNRNSTHCSRHHCPYWCRCEQDFGGVVKA